LVGIGILLPQHGCRCISHQGEWGGEIGFKTDKSKYMCSPPLPLTSGILTEHNILLPLDKANPSIDKETSEKAMRGGIFRVK
jgi:hypothetical protein